MAANTRLVKGILAKTQAQVRKAEKRLKPLGADFEYFSPAFKRWAKENI